MPGTWPKPDPATAQIPVASGRQLDEGDKKLIERKGQAGMYHNDRSWLNDQDGRKRSRADVEGQYPIAQRHSRNPPEATVRRIHSPSISKQYITSASFPFLFASSIAFSGISILGNKYMLPSAGTQLIPGSWLKRLAMYAERDLRFWSVRVVSFSHWV